MTVEREDQDLHDDDLQDQQDVQDQDGAAPAPAGDDEADTPEEIARAKRMGWIPEGEWDDARAERDGIRKPKRFVSAREYIAVAENNVPLLRAQLRSLDAKLADTQKKNTEIYDVLMEQRKLNAAAIERARQEERDKIAREREQAVAEGDVEAFKAADAKLAEMDKPAQGAAPAHTPAAPQQEKAEHPDIVAFKAANASWFRVDPRLTNNMVDEFGDVQRTMPHLSMAAQLEEAKKALVKRFPEKFGINQRREGARSGVTPPTGSREAGSVERRFAALSDEERGAWERVRNTVESRGGKITKAEWLNEIGR